MRAAQALHCWASARTACPKWRLARAQTQAPQRQLLLLLLLLVLWAATVAQRARLLCLLRHWWKVQRAQCPRQPRRVWESQAGTSEARCLGNQA